jgi:hypothetical protein
MMGEKRWLDELPLESAERELLVAGRAARPTRGAVDENWRAFSLVASGSSTAGTSGAGHAASVKTTSGIVLKAGTGGLFGVATVKSFAIGVALGVGVSGTSAVVARVRQLHARPAAMLDRTAALPPREAPEQGPPSRLGERASAVAALAPVPEPSAKKAEPFVHGEPRVAAASLAPLPESSSPAPAVVVGPSEASLSAQARELAVVKRLLDAGATADALHRLEANFSAGNASVLSEERDALYVQALTRAGRSVEARQRARRFVALYPRSPYVEIIRRVAQD